MKPGDVVLIRLPQISGGPPKMRPALFLSQLPGPYQNILIVGISTQLHQIEPAWDELIQSSDPDFAPSGLRKVSVIRLSYLYAADASEVAGSIGQIGLERHERLRARLAKHLQS